METILWMFVRRMRGPIILLIVAYSVSIAGLVLIPGVDDTGAPWRFDFLHALYFVSFMGSTIGFGEIPYAFTPAQRLWVTLCIFLTVIAWLYAIGRIIALIQDPLLRSAMAEVSFVRAVRRLDEPFWVICGCGEAGSLLVRALTHRGVQCVVMDQSESTINRLRLEAYGSRVPAFCGNASDTLHLLEAGMRRQHCQGVVALTGSNDDNIRISVTAKLVRPQMKVIALAGTREAADNLASFATDHVIHPYEVFGEHLVMTQRLPSLHLLHAWLISLPDRRLQGPVTPPRGKWIICGYGRFGQAAASALQAEGNEVRIIERKPEKAPPGAVVGLGTQAGPLREAGIDDAVGIVCGTDSDPNTLSAVMTARALNPDIYVIARQDRRADSLIYNAAHIDLILEISRITVWRILPLIKTPFLSRFLRIMRGRTEAEANAVLERIGTLSGGKTPETWTVRINAEECPALHAALTAGTPVQLGDMLRDHAYRERPLPCLPLLLVRDESDYLLPADDLALRTGDQILLTARHGTRGVLESGLRHMRRPQQWLDGRSATA